MASDGIIPVMNMNPRNNDCGWGGDGWGALVGGAVGAAAGSAWSGNRWNNNNGGGNCGCNNGLGVVMDGISGIREEVGSIGRDQMLQTGGIQSTLCQGFAGTVAAVNAAASQAAQNQSRTEAAVLTTGLQGQIEQKNNTIAGLQAQHAAEVQGLRNAFTLEQSIKDCCCTTNRNIEAQGCENRAETARQGQMTRDLINAIAKEQLLRELCAKDAKISQLENQAFTTTSLNQQLAAILARLPQPATN